MIRRVPLAMSVALEVVAELRERHALTRAVEEAFEERAEETLERLYGK